MRRVTVDPLSALTVHVVADLIEQRVVFCVRLQTEFKQTPPPEGVLLHHPERATMSDETHGEIRP